LQTESPCRVTMRHKKDKLCGGRISTCVCGETVYGATSKIPIS
jgi:hypothetical protein